MRYHPADNRCRDELRIGPDIGHGAQVSGLALFTEPQMEAFRWTSTPSWTEPGPGSVP